MLNEYFLSKDAQVKVGCCQEKQLIEKLTESQWNVFVNNAWNLLTNLVVK